MRPPLDVTCVLDSFSTETLPNRSPRAYFVMTTKMNWRRFSGHAIEFDVDRNDASDGEQTAHSHALYSSTTEISVEGLLAE